MRRREALSHPCISKKTRCIWRNIFFADCSAALQPNSSAFMGCIGTDKDGALLKDLMKQMGASSSYSASQTLVFEINLKCSLWGVCAGIQTLYKEFPSKPTGKCLVLVSEADKDRCVCTSLGAAEDIDLNHAKACASQIEASGAVYCTGFLLSSSKEVSSEGSSD